MSASELGPARRVLAVVVTHNSAADVGGLLDSLGPAQRSGSLGEVVVVDNGSTDDTVAILRARPGVTVVEATNRGYSAGFNLGVRVGGSADYLLLLNPDCRMATDAIQTMVTAAERSLAGIVVPRIHDAHGRLQYSLRREPTIRRGIGLNFTRHPVFAEYINSDVDYEQAQDVDWALGAAMLIRQECYSALGGWDESFFLYSEETDFCLRARDAGWSTRYEPAAVVVHAGGGSGRNAMTHTMQVVNRVRCYGRRHPRPLTYAYLIANLVSEASWVVRGRRESREAVAALVCPRRRPAALRSQGAIIPG
ncbi:MAG: glycosyltransferase family 2 protein [Actinobacteria bacterium]|nr:glycosyltransferase family 2 protein [Actinomycetota bacterium]